ncbi:MAG: hypothetical protein AAFV62_12185 [Pseudomonadota bacterium]
MTFKEMTDKMLDSALQSDTVVRSYLGFAFFGFLIGFACGHVSSGVISLVILLGAALQFLGLVTLIDLSALAPDLEKIKHTARQWTPAGIGWIMIMVGVAAGWYNGEWKMDALADSTTIALAETLLS